MKACSKNESLDPTKVKDILVTCEDTRIAIRLSELAMEISDEDQLREQSKMVQELRLDLRRGQQCVRDFFVCLNENLTNWDDVYSNVCFKIRNSTSCSSCRNVSYSETTQLYVEMQVPPDNSDLSHHVEAMFNHHTRVAYHCEEGCQDFTEGEKRSTLFSIDDSPYLLVILSRALLTEYGYQLVGNKVHSTNDILIR